MDGQFIILLNIDRIFSSDELALVQEIGDLRGDLDAFAELVAEA